MIGNVSTEALFFGFGTILGFMAGFALAFALAL